jgi:hypothetical protein
MPRKTGSEGRDLVKTLERTLWFPNRTDVGAAAIDA